MSKRTQLLNVGIPVLHQNGKETVTIHHEILKDHTCPKCQVARSFYLNRVYAREYRRCTECGTLFDLPVWWGAQ